MASVNIFNDNQDRPLPQGNLPAAHLDFVARHRHHHHRAADSGGTRTTAPAAAAGQAVVARPQLILENFSAAGSPAAWRCFAFTFSSARSPRAASTMAAAELFSGRFAALVHARRGRRHDAARLARFRRAVVQLHHLLRCRRRHFVCGPDTSTRSRFRCRTAAHDCLRDLLRHSASRIFEMRNLIVHDWPLIRLEIYRPRRCFTRWPTSAVFLVAACLVFRRKAVN
jgi:hypothetical protein